MAGPNSAPRCMYCDSGAVKLKHVTQFHRLDPSYGPFDFWECPDCDAGFVFPLPTAPALSNFYSNYDGGMYGAVASQIPGARWHRELARHIIQLSERHFGNHREGTAWIEVGAGGGEIAEVALGAWPDAHGVCTDIHARPTALPSPLRWIQGDALNLLTCDPSLTGRFDLVYCSAVLEHVRDPIALIETCLQLAAHGGLVYFMCPDYGSLARRLMQRRWPYYLVGEHLSIPSCKSIRLALSGQRLKPLIERHSVTPRLLHYNLRYVLSTLGLSAAQRFIPATWRLGLPTGILEFTLIRSH
jgi:SAM-dependent methyltransferase